MTVQRSLFCLAAAMLVAAGGCDESASPNAITVPSGRAVELIDVITNAPGTEGAAARFRFLVPGLGPDDVEAVTDDMLSLCENYAMPRIEGMVPEPQQIIISLASEAVPFGEAAPDVVQFFEAYSVKDDACIWEAF